MTRDPVPVIAGRKSLRESGHKAVTTQLHERVLDAIQARAAAMEFSTSEYLRYILTDMYNDGRFDQPVTAQGADE